MKVAVRSFLTLRNIMPKQTSFEIQTGNLTVRELLEKLCKSYGKALRETLFDPGTGEINRNISILVNGKHYRHLPNGIETSLNDGDEVYIFPPIVGG